jgi:predicted helicase
MSASGSRVVGHGIGARGDRGVSNSAVELRAGNHFKKLMVRYFELDPTISQQYDAVWSWIDWPERQAG